MPLTLALEAQPQQQFTAQLDDKQYSLTFIEVRGAMLVSITIDGLLTVSGSHVISDALLIPYVRLELGGGNFLISSDKDEIPYYTQFGVTQFLYYMTAAELADAR